MTNIRDNEIEHLAVGDIIYECEMFMNAEVRVTEVPTCTVTDEGWKQWRWKAENTQDGSIVDYLLTEGLSHYGPRLYREPQYAKIVDGKPVFPLVGAR
ncbi:UNVERIFIED_ORG: hypothetical protein LHK14_17670 [Roseateles sp. XES5]|nr:hypothetical protein [Roseateles sp. XES5]